MIRKAGSALFPTIQEAISDLPDAIRNGEEELIVLLHPGVYHEKLHLSVPKLRIQGLGEPEECLITYNDGAFALDGAGIPLGTFRTPTVYAESLHLHLENITIANTAGSGKVAGQAIALSLNCREAEITNCRILGDQDTLFLAPLPPQAHKPDGFRGTAAWHSQPECKSIFNACYIEGGVDFIFGGGAAWFERCEIRSLAPPDMAMRAAEDPLGYITAASTPEGQEYGFIFHKCKLTSNCPEGRVYLGRPWRSFARTIFLDCILGEHIHPEGWHDWAKEDAHKTTFYAEANCSGPGAGTKRRVSWSHLLSADESMKYRLTRFIEGNSKT